MSIFLEGILRFSLTMVNFLGLLSISENFEQIQAGEPSCAEDMDALNVLKEVCRACYPVCRTNVWMDGGLNLVGGTSPQFSIDRGNTK